MLLFIAQPFSASIWKWGLVHINQEKRTRLTEKMKQSSRAWIKEHWTGEQIVERVRRRHGDQCLPECLKKYNDGVWCHLCAWHTVFTQCSWFSTPKTIHKIVRNSSGAKNRAMVWRGKLDRHTGLDSLPYM